MENTPQISHQTLIKSKPSKSREENKCDLGNIRVVYWLLGKDSGKRILSTGDYSMTTTEPFIP